MHAFLLGTKGIFNRAAAVLSVAGLWLLIASGLVSYKQAGDAQGERLVLELLFAQARDPALLRLAGLTAAEANLKDAIEIARRTDQRGELAQPRASLMESLREKLREKGVRK